VTDKSTDGRKPPGASWESWTELRIRQGMASGEFDNLAGKGKAIVDIDGPHDEDWWLKAKMPLDEEAVVAKWRASRA